MLFVTDELFTCPLCGLVCSSSFLLQEHVELHLEEKNAATGNNSKSFIFVARDNCLESKYLSCVYKSGGLFFLLPVHIIHL